MVLTRFLLLPLLAAFSPFALAAPYDQWYEPLELRAVVDQRLSQQPAGRQEPSLQYVRFDDWELIAETVKRLRSEGKEVLVATDLDNTLLKQLQDFGTEQWWDAMAAALAPLKATDRALYKERFQILLALAHRVVQLSPTEPVQEDAPEIVAEIQRQGAKMIGLTLRSDPLREATLRNLRQWNIDLSRAPIGADFKGIEGFPGDTAFQGGVFFAAGHHKGKMLIGLLKRLNYRPDVVIFIDDKSLHHNGVFASCLAENLPVMGYQFTREHAFIVDYKQGDQARARVQMKRFLETGVLLSDREAELQREPVPSWPEINTLVYGVPDPARP